MNLSKFIHDSTKIWLGAEVGIEPKDKVKIQTGKFKLGEDIQEGTDRLQELLARFYGERTAIAKDMEQYISVKTAFREFAVVENDFVDMGQGNNW